MVCHREQAVRIGRQVDADNIRFLVHDVINEAGVLMAETVVVLTPDVRAEEIIERRDRPPPGDVARHLEPFRMLIEHRVHDMNEAFVAGEKTVTSGEQITFQPALAHVLTQDFHDTPVWRQVLIRG